MPLPDIEISKADVDASLWEEVTKATTPKVCSRYSRVFWTKADEAEESGNTVVQAAYAMLGAVTSFHLKPSERKAPFAPMFVLGTNRSAILEDLTEHHWAFLESIADDISDAEFRARVDDVLWVGKRRYHRAVQAVDAYLAAASALEDPQLWSPATDRIERALRLAALISNPKNEQPIEMVIAYIEAMLGKYENNDPAHLSAKLMDFLLEFERGDALHYASYAENAARSAEQHGEWHWARKYWDTAAQWLKQTDAAKRRRSALLCAARSHVHEADALVRRAPPNFFGAWFQLRQAIEALYPLEGTQRERERLHARMLSYQEKATAEARRIEVPMDTAALAEAATAAVADKPLNEALVNFALLGCSPSVETLQDLVGRITQVAVFSSHLPMMMLTPDGRVAAERPGLQEGESGSADIYLRNEMFSQARHLQQAHASAMVEPARRTIGLDHPLRRDDLLPFIQHSPFVPPGRELLYLQGLLAGFEGDFVVAVHLLVPQVENSLRYVLARRGVITSKLEQGIQDERDLGSLFYTYPTELEAAFGPDTVFDLQGLLVERFGTNLRNLLSHGLLSYGEVQSFQGEYFWWLTWHLVVVGALSAQRALQKAQSDTASDTPQEDQNSSLENRQE